MVLGLTAWAEPRLLEVPLAPQTTNYSCGAASMQSVLGYYGFEFTERELMRKLNTRPNYGTDHKDMIKLAHTLGIAAEVKHNQTVEHIRQELAKGYPVIVDFQAWPDKPLEKPYLDTWDQGHYAVVVGVDDANLYFVDPVIFGGKGYIPIAEFRDRWHDLGERNEKLYSTILYFHAKPSPPVALQSIP